MKVGLFEVKSERDITAMLEALEETATPFVLYKDPGYVERIKEVDGARLKGAGLMGVITRQTPLEEIAFVVNRATFLVLRELMPSR